MPCCGQSRRSLRRGPSGHASEASGRPAGAPPRRLPGVFLRYDGRTALRVRGPVSGRLYHFERPGAVLAVDRRDRAALSRVPRLRRVGRP